MADWFDQLDEKHVALLEATPVYFVATAPKDGRINLSPKGMDTLRVLDPRTVAWLDLTGSGNETAAHLLDDGRITLMVCSFTRNAMILRLYGTAESIQPGHADWPDLLGRFPVIAGTRQIFRMAVQSVQTSCGYAVPQMALEAERQTLRTYAERMGEDRLMQARGRNRVSIDGLPTGLTNFREAEPAGN